MGTNITGIGNANAIGFKSRVTGGMYFPPELKDALVGVWSAYGKSNDSTDRNIIKNKIKDRGGDFELINFNYEGTSGYNGYPVVFGKDKTYQYVNHSPNYNQTTINVTHFNTRQALLYSYIQRNGELTSYNRDYPSYKIKVSGLEEGFGLMYQYNSKADATSVNALRIETNGIYTIPKSFASDGSLTNANIWVGFVFTGTEQEQCNVTIEVLPEYKGAVVTDGVDDMIISTKTVSEMLEGSNEVTVISMIRQIKNSPDSIIRNNWMFRPEYYLENRVSDESIGKSGIYGYTSSNISGAQVSVINNILGDKNDYTGNSKIESTSLDYFSVEGFRHSDGNMWYLSQVAWYWTFIAKRVLTEDEINLVIEKYNLDRPGEVVKPNVYYDIKRQKINNENHSSFDDELTDFSGNGHNMKLYNIAWEGNSGIGNYPVVFGANKTWKNLRAEDNNLSYKLIANSITVYKVLPNSGAIMWTYIKENEIIREIEIPSFTVKVSGTKNGDRVRYYYVDENSTFKNTIFDITEDGTYVLPKCNKLQITESTPSTNIFIGFAIILNDNPSTGVTIEVIPSNENTICLDGVDDYGKVTGMPIYKDYTVVVDREIENINGSLLSKEKSTDSGAFIFEYYRLEKDTTTSFGYLNYISNLDRNRKISYQSKYSYNGVPLSSGTRTDSTAMYLGTIREGATLFSKSAIYSLMSFPYSLSEFLIERQIKKARAGTLYPNQVEFRPIIPEDENITRIDYFVVNSGTWTIIKPGDYVDVRARIVFNVYTKLPYKVEKVSSPAFTGMSVRHSTELNIFDVEGYIKDKTPQKIKLTLAVNEDIVQWNPTITSNLLDSFTASSWYLNGWDNTITTGTWIKKTDRVFFKATFKTELYGLETATFGGAECVVSKADNWSDSKNIWDIRMLGTVGDLSQVFNLDVYELIRFEDIVQPYPVLLRFNDKNGNEVSWGGKFKVGSTITRIGSIADPESNLLNGLYSISGLSLNGKAVTSSTSIVEKQMVFRTTATWLLGDNEPKCIFSPSKLRMPNESYRYLGYIPDISGNGNNGVFNNFAFSKMSGVNGYLEDFTTLRDYGIKGIVRTDSKIYLDESFDYDKGFWLGYTNVPSPAYKVKISGIPETGMLTYTGGVWLNLTNGINELPARTNTAENHGFVVQSPNLDWSNLVIEQIPEYEGSICFDGVDDYITIPTLSEGGKQVLMKVNWQKQDTMLYNQNPGQDNFAIFTNDYNNNNLVVAYASRNNGNTYIDGVVNNNILATQLKGITHNIVATNNNIDATITPIIGSNKNHDNFFAQMALYDFMLFDEISTDEEIKELNNIVGIEGDYVQKPSYYWDAYGKSNLDVDKGYIKDQVSLQLNNDTTNNNSLENFNFGYEGMSGYNGYPVIFGANKTWKNKAPEGPNSYICTINANKYNITQILLSNAWTYSYIKENGELTKYNKDVGSFKIKVTGLKSEIPLRYSYLSSTDATVTSNITIKSDGTYELPKSFANDGSLIDNYGWIGFSFTRVSVDIPEIITDVNITIEILPEYKNGLVYDGVDDYSENASIPLLSDYTYIFKRTLLNKKYNSASIFKGSNQQSGGGAFICDYNSVEPDLLTQGYSFGAGLYVDSLNADSIVYGTRGSVNGTKITAGNNTDTEGLTVGKWRAYKEMVFYKLFLYPRTVNMLSINMVKNMMEEDGIIDLTSKLFTDKYTGDFYEMDFNNDFLIGN